MPDSLATRGVCCDHSLNWHNSPHAGGACSSGGCRCKKYVSPDSEYDRCEAVLEGELPHEDLRCTLERRHVDKGINHQNRHWCWTEEATVYPVKDSPAASTQVGGDHYVKRAIGPWDIWAEYGMNAFEGAVLKYLLRWRDKGGVEDLKKARHTLDRLIEIEESKGGTEAG